VKADKTDGDVEEFLRPEVDGVECKGAACTLHYVVDVPGRGRILEQQRDMVKRVFSDADVDKLTIRVTRGIPTGPEASPPTGEETIEGALLLVTSCDRGKQPGLDVEQATELEIMQALCTDDVPDQGGQHGRGRGAEKSGKGRGAEKS
jgi:hypothetical protein